MPLWDTLQMSSTLRNSSSMEFTTRLVETSWQRILAIAQNHLYELPHEDMPRMQAPATNVNGAGGRTTSAQSSRRTSRSSNTASSATTATRRRSSRRVSSQEFYDRERRMIHALDTLFNLAYEAPGYLAFIGTIISSLDPESPVAMAFLSHVVDRATLPSRDTMSAVSPVMLAKLNKPHRQLYRTLSWLLARSSWYSKNISWRIPCPQCDDNRTDVQSRRHDAPSTLLKLNATTLWALLAEKFAGDLARKLYHYQVGDLMLHFVADSEEDLRVRMFAIIALEKFALTGLIKEEIMQHPCNIREILWRVIRECEEANHRIYLLSSYSPASSLGPTLPLHPPSPLFQQQQQQQQQHHHQQQKKSMSRKKWHWFKKQLSGLFETGSQKRRKRRQQEDCWSLDDSPSLDNKDKDLLDDFYLKSVAMELNSFDTGFIPPEGQLRQQWVLYVQLAHCARWALDSVFCSGEKLACSWNLTHLNATMNIFDCTRHLKIGSNGLEIRNDHPHFESIRATASVNQGKWYYEALLLTTGIMQLGWATNRCRFSPEEGYGVGDDCHGFAFDTYRTAVWADGSAVYPRGRPRVHCRAGDVLGSFIDIDNGLCTFFINGCDLGLTVEFDHPARTERRGTGLGLFPAVSLTTHQHVLLNLGDRPWMFPPPVRVKYKGICQANTMTEEYRSQVRKHVKMRAKKYKNKDKSHQHPHQCRKRCTSSTAAAAYSSSSSSSSSSTSATTTTSSSTSSAADAGSCKSCTSSESEYDWDGPLCTICFSEPKDVILLPCLHTGWGQNCARELEHCPLCRSKIESRRYLSRNRAPS